MLQYSWNRWNSGEANLCLSNYFGFVWPVVRFRMSFSHLSQIYLASLSCMHIVSTQSFLQYFFSKKLDSPHKLVEDTLKSQTNTSFLALLILHRMIIIILQICFLLKFCFDRSLLWVYLYWIDEWMYCTWLCRVSLKCLVMYWKNTSYWEVKL